MTQNTKESNIMPQTIISAQNLTQKIQLAQKQLTIFENLNLDIQAGEQVAITGRSGSGKSTLLGILATLDQASSGKLLVCGESIAELNEEQRAEVRLKHIGFVFQSFQLLPHLTALENVMLPLRLQEKFKYAAAEQKALNLLKRVGLERQAQQTPKVLSGGEQQRVAIARALIREPKIIFADEPTGNLDGETATEIEQLLFELNRELGTTLVLVTHDPKLAAQCQRHYALIDGQLVEQFAAKPTAAITGG
ncbi:MULTISPECIES: ABC transporter ATP-binding protein [Acinetobacter]|uniref:ABC transporter ATP-binding protein n=1 Tax=Acinetobacter towneri TaxID=202956 RepID=A0A1E8E0Q4_9GAMM|nr:MULTISPECIES: ABC transporter ATP-binding protein [Acinetobacter]MCD0187449.1 ABC transporter ATP-binding protein [Acinetobacter sp. PW68]MCO8055455.1 ABC transporter ATP-binding protein [Acinetobacter towneri]MDM1755746.1 ABC transporter ATP-binding protein [Acinetobacter towneri]OFE42803.1 ABC transporter ATP-binding protein [Acinetobacter towneri]GJC30032.1 ABC transporter ATP-binding protein [Acinetobacter sp. KAM392]